MKLYKAKKLRPLRLLAISVRLFIQLLHVWPLILIAAFFISPVGPHFLLDYIYEQRGSYRHMISCNYIGSRGPVAASETGDCPYIVFMDSRTGKRVAPFSQKFDWPFIE